MILVLVVIAALAVAWTNGANANFKGVASLYGSDTTSLRQALHWGTWTTFAGSIAALFLADKLLKSFSGRGLVPDTLAAAPEFAFSVGMGAACTSFLATRFGFPVSTTHALVGSLVGGGLVFAPAELSLSGLGKNFAMPLLVSPLMAVVVGIIVTLLVRFASKIVKGKAEWARRLHFLSAGAASFARGLNDTPKMAALLLVVGSEFIHLTFIAIGITIAAGALLDTEKVAETLGKKITEMDQTEGLSASLSTALLVTTASLHGLPVSTTHCSVGSMTGVGIVNRQAKWPSVTKIAAAWAITLPVGALTAAAFAALTKLF